MALQPLVENAIRHGIAQDPSAGRVEVSVRRRDQSLRVEVRNDGPTYTGGGAGREAGGVGLSNIRARLRRLYGSGYLLELLPDQERGTLAVLEVPWRSEREELR